MKRGGVVLAIALAGIAVWTACVGDDGGPVTTTPSGEGAQNQKCYANGTCLVGLTCVSDVCVVGDGGTSNDGAASSSSSSSSSSGMVGPSGDAGTFEERNTCGTLSDSSGPTCPHGGTDDSCAPFISCCPGTGCERSGPCNTGFLFECFSNDQCDGNENGEKCCMRGTRGPKPAAVHCVDEVITPAAGSSCKQTCATDELELCSTESFQDGNEKCTSGTCTAIGIEITDNDGAYTKVVGLCQ